MVSASELHFPTEQCADFRCRYGSAYFLTSTALQPSYGRIYKTFNVCTLKGDFGCG